MPTLTIDLTPEQAQRIAVAIGLELGLKDDNGVPRSANAEEVRREAVEHYKLLVKNSEVKAARLAAAASVTELGLE